MPRAEARAQGNSIRQRLQRDHDAAREIVGALSDVTLSDAWLVRREQLGKRTWWFKLTRRAGRILAPLRPVGAAVFRALPESLRRRLRSTRT